MSADSFAGYELLTRVSDGSARSYHALSRTGAVVMVHFLDETGETAARASAMIERLPPRERRKVIEIAPAREGLVVVTKFILDFDSLFAWLAELVPEIPPAAANPGPAAVADDEPGEFTRAFRALSGVTVPETGPPAPAAAPGTPPGHAPPPPAPAGPGEFTRAFRAITGEPAARPPGDLAAAGDAGDAASSAPRTRPVSPPETPVAPPAGRGFDPGMPPVAAEPAGSAEAGPGEVTRMFGAIPTPPAEPSSGAAHPAVPPPPPAPPPAPPAPPAAAGTPDPGGWLPAPGNLPAPNLTGAPPHEPVPPTVQSPAIRWADPLVPPAGQPAPEPPPPGGPGEFTRMFGKVERPSPLDPPVLPEPLPGGSGYRTPAAPVTPGGPLAAPLSGAAGDDYLFRLGGRGPTIDPVSPPPPPSAPQAPPPAAGGPAIPPWLGGGPLDGGLTPPPQAGPSEYTRVISAMTQPPAPPVTPAPVPPAPVPAMPPVAPPPAPAPARPVMLLALIALVVALALAVILFFVLRPPTTGAPEGEEPAQAEAPV